MQPNRLFAPLFALSFLFAACSTPGPAGSQRVEISTATWDGSVLSGDRSRSSFVAGTRGMVVADDREAAEWGAEILRNGGNAVDAAVATAFAMSVTRPHLASLGGGGFFVYCPAPTAAKAASQDRKPPKCHIPKCYILDYREKAPSAATRDMYLKDGKVRTDLAQFGPLASGVPGVTAGLLTALERFGTVSRQKVLSRPIELATRGIRFSTGTERAAMLHWSTMNSEAKRIFGCGKTDAPCTAGSILKQPELARVLKEISRRGKSGFYEGWVAKTIAKSLQNAGGIMKEADLANYAPAEREPLHGRFAGMEIVTMPPPSSGGAILLQLLAYLERADKQGQLDRGFASIPAIHATAHAMSLAFADRSVSFGDPDFVSVPIAQLLSENYLDSRWKTFDPSQASFPPPGASTAEPKHLHTTHFSVIDRDGNAVAITTTINELFGSGFVPPGSGIVMNDEMDDFSASPGAPNLFGLVGSEANAIAPGKRPLSSMTPTIVRDTEGRNRIVIGAQGGPRIITSVFHSLLNRLRYGMSLPDAVASSRFHEQWKPRTLRVERFGFPEETRAALTRLGYSLEEVGHLGVIHALERFENGRVWGAPDPRSEGAAVAE